MNWKNRNPVSEQIKRGKKKTRKYVTEPEPFPTVTFKILAQYCIYTLTAYIENHIKYHTVDLIARYYRAVSFWYHLCCPVLSTRFCLLVANVVLVSPCRRCCVSVCSCISWIIQSCPVSAAGCGLIKFRMCTRTSCGP